MSDAIKKRFETSPPFPTISAEALAALPRELSTGQTGKDPLLEEVDA